MIFDRLRINDIVVWNKPAIQASLEVMINGSMWKHEQFGCHLQVTKMRNDALGADIELTCVEDCGQHMTTTMTRAEYEDYFDELQDDIFVFANSLYDIGKIYAAPDMKEAEYDFSTDSAEILEQIIEGVLPAYRKRTA